MLCRLFGAVVALALSVAVSAQAYAGYASIVMDAKTGDVLQEVNADTLNYPASLTKIMTLYVAFDAIKGGRLTLHKAMRVSEHAAAQSPTKLGLRPGQSIKVVDAVFALITKSANDAAVVLAEEIGGTEWEFARMMTAKAAELGMTSTVFRNASGLPDAEQVSTARDLARLSQALIQNHPEYYGYFATQAFSYDGRLLESHNRFMKGYPGADGIKTGFIRASGFNLAGSAVRNGRRLISVVMGGETARWRDLHMAALLDRGFGSEDGSALVASASNENPTAGEGEERPRIIWHTPSAAGIQQAAFTPDAKPTARASDLGVMKVPADPKPTGQAGEIGLIKKGLTRSAAPAAAPEPEPKGGWTIQVGVFAEKDNARKIAEQALDIADLPSSAKIGVSAVKQRGKQVYRARLTGISRSVAIDACKKLEKRKRDCMAFDSDA